MKKKIVIYLLVASMLTVTNGCGNTVKEATTETGTEEALEETSVEASTEQSTEETAEPVAEKQNKPEINEDLLGAIEQLADGQEQAVSGTEHSFYGWYSDEYLEGEWIWPQIDRSADDIEYDKGVTVVVTEAQKAFIKAHSYDEFKITYVLADGMTKPDWEVEAVKIELASDEEVTRGLTDAGPDPLKNLVADDILEKFRASRPVKYPDSIYGEGDVLGRWAMATIGKNNIPEEVREKGRHIGAAHEYWFGTDIANNFSNNIPTMYGTYYALKDYYTSEGRNSAEFYQEMKDDCWGSDPDKDATIKKMYESLKDVISDLNNLIRAQQ